MPHAATVRHERFAFADLREVFARANEEKSGDQLAGHRRAPASASASPPSSPSPTCRCARSSTAR